MSLVIKQRQYNYVLGSLFIFMNFILSKPWGSIVMQSAVQNRLRIYMRVCQTLSSPERRNVEIERSLITMNVSWQSESHTEIISLTLASWLVSRSQHNTPSDWLLMMTNNSWWLKRSGITLPLSGAVPETRGKWFANWGRAVDRERR